MRTLELDSHLAEAYTSLALISEKYDYDWKKSERLFRRAIELDPNYATAHHWYAEFLTEAEVLVLMGRPQEARKALRKAEQLNPSWDAKRWKCIAAKVGLGGKEDLLACLKDACQHHYDLSGLKVSSHYDSLRSDPRFQDLLHRVGLELNGDTNQTPSQRLHRPVTPRARVFGSKRTSQFRRREGHYRL